MRYRAPLVPTLAKPADPKPAGFSFSFAGLGKLFAARFKLALLGAFAATGRTNLAAHRCSNRL
jgi:hypothetical protein